jgi:hypothetical protein
MPPLRWRAEPAGRCSADFALTLVGVERTEPANAAAIWPLTLEEAQTLQVIHQLEDGRWQSILRARVGGDNERKVFDGARELWRNLRIILQEIYPGYRFVSRDDPPSPLPPAGHWQAFLRPAGVRVALRSIIGYVGVPDCPPGEPAVRLSYPAGQGVRFFKLPDAAYPGALALSLTLEPLCLQPPQRRRLHAILASLQGDSVRCSLDPSDLEIDDPAVLDALRRELAHWCSEGAGWRLRLAVSAPAPLPEVLLALIGMEVFPGRPVRWDAPVDRPAPEPVLDLSDAIPRSGCLPPLLPAARLLLQQGLPPYYPRPPDRVADTGVLLGHTESGYRRSPVRFAPADRARHCYVLGATGTGKSTLLYNLLVQDIEAGAGVCLLDPHGDLYQQVLRAVPPARLADVVLVEPGDEDRAVGLNFLERRGPRPAVQMNFITNEMIQIVDRLYDLRQTGGPMFEQYLRNALLLVMDNERADGTLMDVPLLFENREFREALLRSCRNPYVASFWRHQADRVKGDVSLENMTPYITSKLNQFTSNALLRPIIGQPESTLDLQDCMERGRIVLVNLPKGILGALDARLLGMLIVGKLFDAALQRIQMDCRERRPFFLYVDEAQHFTTDTLAQLLAEARKFGLYLTLANQHLGQVFGTLDAILGNVGSLLLFRTGALDAERLATYVRPELAVRDLEDLPDHHAIARLLVRGQPTRPFAFATAPPRLPAALSTASDQANQRILAEQRLAYTRPIADVERAILARRGCS